MERAKTAEQKIRHWVDGMLAQVVNEEAASATRPFSLSRARLSELFPAEVTASEAQLTGVLRAAIQEAIDSGHMPKADAERDAEVINNMVMGWIERKMAVAQPPKKMDVEHLNSHQI